VRAVAGLVQFVLGAAGDDLLAELDEGLQNIAQLTGLTSMLTFSVP